MTKNICSKTKRTVHADEQRQFRRRKITRVELIKWGLIIILPSVNERKIFLENIKIIPIEY